MQQPSWCCHDCLKWRPRAQRNHASYILTHLTNNASVTVEVCDEHRIERKEEMAKSGLIFESIVDTPIWPQQEVFREQNFT